MKQLSPVYISGPMSGIEEYNFPAFLSAENTLTNLGFSVLNPAKIPNAVNLGYAKCLNEAIWLLLKAKSITMLDGWASSKGASLELQIARALDIAILDADTGKEISTPRRPTILEEASNVVDGDRQASYGHPYNNHSCTAALWSAYLAAKNPGLIISAEDVCWMQILTKVSRSRNGWNRDNAIDTAGYARNIEMIHDYEEWITHQAPKEQDN